MRAASDAVRTAVSRGARTRLEVVTWLGVRRLASLPVVTGSWAVEDADDQQVPGVLRFDVPNTPQWRPTGPGHPLAGMGQQAQVRVGIETDEGTEWIPLGRFRLQAPSRAEDVLSVTGVGLLENVQRSRLLAPFKSSKGATRAQTISRLLGGIIPWRMAGGIKDEPLPQVTIDRERLEGIREIVDAWPARLAVTDTGILEVRPPWDDASPGPVVKAFNDGPGGTLVSVSAQPDTSSMFNGYSVSTVPEGDAQPVTESWVMPSGPLAWTGPYGQFPGFFASPALPADRARLRAVARALTDRAQRRRDAYEVTAAPDPRVQVGDVVSVRSRLSGIEITGRVTRITHRRPSLTCTVAYLSGARP